MPIGASFAESEQTFQTLIMPSSDPAATKDPVVSTATEVKTAFFDGLSSGFVE